ncbi:MAG: hypothetical protein HQ567_06890 [Candidatus Nealsonbacteria bacterium]|nr:hypothetical protein [Candidatus Nealsonbacteria bacterium]
MAGVLSAKSIKTIEKGILAGKCLTLIPDRRGSARVVESDEFLSPEESETLLQSVSQPTPGTYLEQFIWEFTDGSTKRFAEKVGYHPNRISTVKSAGGAISARLFRRIVEAYKLGKKERDFWGKRLLDI